MQPSHHHVARVFYAASGQGALIAIAMSLLIAMVVIGSAISNLAVMNAKRTVEMERSLETYYIAQAGIREALSSHMIPRTNYLSFVPTGSRPLPAVRPISGRVYERPQVTPPQGLVGIYRYFVLGGDPSRNTASTDLANKQYWPNTAAEGSNLLDNVHRQPFIVVSRGAVCRHPETRQVIYDAITYTPGIGVSCSNNNQLDQLIVVAQVDMSGSSASCSGGNCVQSYRMFYNDTFRAAIPLYASYNGASQIAAANTDIPFEAVWEKSVATPGDSAPAAIAFYSPSDTTPTVFQLINGGPNQGSPLTIAQTLPSNTMIRLLFNGNIDTRIIQKDVDGTLRLSGPNGVAACKNNVAQCYVQIWQINPAGNPVSSYSNAVPMPTVPGSSQLVLFPPAAFNNALASGQQYELRVLPSLPSFDGRPAASGANYWAIRFTTN